MSGNVIDLAKKKLKAEFLKGNTHTQMIINGCLLFQIQDEHFAKRVLLDNKDMNKCYSFIESCVKKFSSKGGGFPPAVIYSLAIHYFEEDNPQYIPEMMEYNLDFDSVSNDIVVKKLDTATIVKEQVKTVEKFKKVDKEIKPKVSTKKVVDHSNQLDLFTLLDGDTNG